MEESGYVHEKQIEAVNEFIDVIPMAAICTAVEALEILVGHARLEAIDEDSEVGIFARAMAAGMKEDLDKLREWLKGMGR